MARTEKYIHGDCDYNLSYFPLLFPSQNLIKIGPYAYTPGRMATRHQILLVLLLSLALRSFVGLWGYSGHNTPPMFGDFEAQRHWMEITYNLPMVDWYRNTALNNLQYWGLDYPPLTAYVSLMFARIATFVVPDIVTLTTSRGYETELGKTFMRSTVLWSDILFCLPVVVAVLVAFNWETLQLASRWAVFDIERYQPKIRTVLTQSALVKLFCCCLLAPGIILIDHGHFQYNAICIYLAILAALAVLADRDILGSILFCCSLNFKQMALYYAPVFFFALIRKCVTKPTNAQGLMHFTKIGFSVIATFAIFWAPFCFSQTIDVDSRSDELTCAAVLGQILFRLFPFSRGIFEDKVGNLWFMLSIVYDYRQTVSIAELKVLSSAATLFLLFPVCWDLCRKPLTETRLLLALCNSATAFFLVSFQVHEKSILLLLVPASLLLLVNQQLPTTRNLLLLNEPISEVVHQTNIAIRSNLQHHWLLHTLGCFSMFPLLVKDGQRVPYYCCMGIFHLLNFYVFITTSVSPTARNSYTVLAAGVAEEEDKRVKSEAAKSPANDPMMALSQEERERKLKELENHKKRQIQLGNVSKTMVKMFMVVTTFGMFALHMGELFITPPQRYPDLYPVLFALFTAAQLVISYCYGIYWQLFRLPIPISGIQNKTKAKDKKKMA